MIDPKTLIDDYLLLGYKLASSNNSEFPRYKYLLEIADPPSPKRFKTKLDTDPDVQNFTREKSASPEKSDEFKKSGSLDESKKSGSLDESKKSELFDIHMNYSSTEKDISFNFQIDSGFSDKCSTNRAGQFSEPTIRPYQYVNPSGSSKCGTILPDQSICNRRVKNTRTAQCKHKHKFHAHMFGCKCGKWFGDQRTFLIHECKLKYKHTCPVCNIHIPNMKTLIKHCNTEPQPYKIKVIEYELRKQKLHIEKLEKDKSLC